MDGDYTAAYILVDHIVVDEAPTVAQAARQARAAGLTLDRYEAHGKAGSWYIECHDYDRDGNPIGDNGVKDEDVRQAFA